jgi:ABC-type Fe3+-hydroxamate transport system substrate-binding protein
MLAAPAANGVPLGRVGSPLLAMRGGGKVVGFLIVQLGVLLFLILFHSGTSGYITVYITIGAEAPDILAYFTPTDRIIRIQPGELESTAAGLDAPIDLDTARARDIPVITVRRHISITDIVDNIRTLSRVSGVPVLGEVRIAQLWADVLRVRVQVRDLPTVRVLMLTPEGYTPGSGALITEMIAFAGGVNVSAEAGIPDARQISDEQIREFAPDVILLLNWDAGAAEAFAANPIYAGIPAFESGRIHTIDAPSRLASEYAANVARLADVIRDPVI